MANTKRRHQEAKTFKELRASEGKKRTAYKDSKAVGASYVGQGVGFLAGAGGVLAASRGVNAGRGVKYAVKSRGVKEAFRARHPNGHRVAGLAAKAGAKFPNQRAEVAVLPVGVAGAYAGSYVGSKRSYERSYPNHEITRYGARKKVEKSMHISKAKEKDATPGRYIAGGAFPGFHGAAAGKPGHKLKAAGYEVGSAILIPVPGGGAVGTHFAHKAGHYKKQKVKKSMSASVWGVDHGAEVSKAFTPVLGRAGAGAQNPGIKRGLKMAAGPKPMGVPKPPSQFGAAAQRIQGRQRFGAGQQSALGNRLGGGVRKSFDNTSVWGVDHGPEEISKGTNDAARDKRKARNAAAFGAIPGFGAAGAIYAGSQSKKGRGAAVGGRTFGRQMLESGVGSLAGAALTRGKPVGQMIGSQAGSAHGAYAATRNAGRRGDLNKRPY